MPFKEISGKNLRNLEPYKLTPSPAINVIAGKNGAGKTNLLEAIYLNALGRSFRTSATRNLIADDQASCWVFAEYIKKISDVNSGATGPTTHKIGVERKKGNYQKININGVRHNSLAELASLAPVLAIQPSETQLIDGGSAIRRKYLDWLMFHVEPSFLNQWRDNQRLLKQRNQLLRAFSKKGRLSKADRLEVKTWDQAFIMSCESLNKMREQTVNSLLSHINRYLHAIPAFAQGGSQSRRIEIELNFDQGWAKEKTLEQSLDQSLQQDIYRGFTRSGSHRSDLIIRANGHQAKEYLSRGQKKLLSMLMRLAQAQELKQHPYCPKPILLLDDLFAELDQDNVKSFIHLFEELDTQVFLTCLNTETWVQGLLTKDSKVFHVEHGKIAE